MSHHQKNAAVDKGCVHSFCLLTDVTSTDPLHLDSSLIPDTRSRTAQHSPNKPETPHSISQATKEA